MRAIVLALAKVILGVGIGTVALSVFGSYAWVDGLLDCYLIVGGVLLYPIMSLRQPSRPAAVRVRRKTLHRRLPEARTGHPQRSSHRDHQAHLPAVNRPLVTAAHRRLNEKFTRSSERHPAALEPRPAPAPALHGLHEPLLGRDRRQVVLPAQ